MQKHFLMMVTSVTFAQISQKQSIEDSVLGWVKVYHFKGVKEGKKLDNRVAKWGEAMGKRKNTLSAISGSQRTKAQE